MANHTLRPERMTDEKLAAITQTAPNKFHALTSKDELVFAHGARKALAADLRRGQQKLQN